MDAFETLRSPTELLEEKIRPPDPLEQRVAVIERDAADNEVRRAKESFEERAARKLGELEPHLEALLDRLQLTSTRPFSGRTDCGDQHFEVSYNGTSVRVKATAHIGSSKRPLSVELAPGEEHFETTITLAPSIFRNAKKQLMGYAAAGGVMCALAAATIDYDTLLHPVFSEFPSDTSLPLFGVGAFMIYRSLKSLRELAREERFSLKEIVTGARDPDEQYAYIKLLYAVPKAVAQAAAESGKPGPKHDAYLRGAEERAQAYRDDTERLDTISLSEEE